MKKISISILIIFTINCLNGQDVVEFVKSNQSHQKEKYLVLKNDTSIKHGVYELYNKSDLLLIKGNYNNNNKTRVWEYYNKKGELELSYDYSKNSLINYKPIISDNKKYIIIQGNDTIESNLERPPLPVGTVWWKMENVNYPDSAKNNNISGVVVIAYTVDNLGNINNFRVKKGIGYGCDEEALRVARITILNNCRSYIPAVLNNKTVSVEFTYPIKFKLL